MSVFETRFDQLFPVFSSLQMETARRFANGEARHFAPGELIYDVGVRNAPVWLVLDGGIEIVRRDGLHRESSVVLLSEGQFSGEVSSLAGRGTLAAGRAGPDGCTALPFDAAHIRALVIGSAELGEILMRAFILRRVALHPGWRRRFAADRPRRFARTHPAAGLPRAQQLSLHRA